ESYAADDMQTSSLAFLWGAGNQGRKIPKCHLGGLQSGDHGANWQVCALEHWCRHQRMHSHCGNAKDHGARSTSALLGDQARWCHRRADQLVEAESSAQKVATIETTNLPACATPTLVPGMLEQRVMQKNSWKETLLVDSFISADYA